MSTFEELFADMGAGYSNVVRAHLELKAEQGNPDAVMLLGGGAELPRPGDVVIAKDSVWVWDSPDGASWSWWSPSLRQTEVELEDYQRVIWHGQRADRPTDGQEPEMPLAAIQLYEAVDWMLATATLCSVQVNPKTDARFYQPIGIDTVGELLATYQVPPSAPTKEDRP
jgi:hypothetical protein